MTPVVRERPLDTEKPWVTSDDDAFLFRERQEVWIVGREVEERRDAPIRLAVVVAEEAFVGAFELAPAIGGLQPPSPFTV
ncbi:MAG: hypothetical protein GEV06_25620 [Luteitalea sp.]|nr:hypothetical protein [Luteitalea sp.]